MVQQQNELIGWFKKLNESNHTEQVLGSIHNESFYFLPHEYYNYLKSLTDLSSLLAMS